MFPIVAAVAAVVSFMAGGCESKKEQPKVSDKPQSPTKSNQVDRYEHARTGPMEKYWMNRGNKF